jgi:hypothetical protein
MERPLTLEDDDNAYMENKDRVVYISNYLIGEHTYCQG